MERGGRQLRETRVRGSTGNRKEGVQKRYDDESVYIRLKTELDVTQMSKANVTLSGTMEESSWGHEGRLRVKYYFVYTSRGCRSGACKAGYRFFT